MEKKGPAFGLDIVRDGADGTALVQNLEWPSQAQMEVFNRFTLA